MPAAIIGVGLWVVLTVSLFRVRHPRRERPPAFLASAYLFSLLGWLGGAQIGAKVRQRRPGF